MTTVYLLFRTQMFREAVSAILQTAPAIELVGMAEEIGQALAEMDEIQPDVLFWEQPPDGSASADVTALLNSPTPPRLILLRLDGDEISIWSPSRRGAVHAQDLLDAVLAGDEPQRKGAGTPPQQE